MIGRAAAATLVLGALFVSGAADLATGRGAPIGDGEGAVTLDEIGAFDSPVNVAFAPGVPDNVYVVEQDGTVEVLVSGVEQPDPFLDIRGLTNESGEQGLLGLAFHPDYQLNGLVYAYYTDSANGDIVVSEFAADTDQAADETVARARSSASGTDSPRITTAASSCSVPTTACTWGRATAARRATRARTPRTRAACSASSCGSTRSNPAIGPIRRPPATRSRTGGDGTRSSRAACATLSGSRSIRCTERIAIGDVGQDRFEEVDYEAPDGLRNANFGWDRWEGFQRYRDGDSARTPKPKHHDKPIFAYGQRACGGGCSVIGGVVVRDPDLPNLYGRYLFADAYAGRLRSFIPKLGGAEDVKYLDQDPADFPTSFAADPVTNDVYMTTIDGPVYRLEPRGATC